MKKTNIISFAVMFLLLIPTFTSAQLVKIGVGGGITQVLGPESLTDGITTEESYYGGAGFSTEWNAGLIGKLVIPMLPITPKGFIIFHSFSGSKTFSETGTDFTIEKKQSVLEIGLGAQYNFIPAPLGFDPYISLDLSYNSFGDFTTTVPGSEIKSEGFNRFGGGIGFGTEISIIPVVNLDLYLSYKMFNLTGKEDGEETISAVTLDAFIIFNFL